MEEARPGLGGVGIRVQPWGYRGGGQARVRAMAGCSARARVGGRARARGPGLGL